MKIKPDDYIKLSNMLDAGVENCGLPQVRKHRARRLGQDIEKRFRWDLFHLSDIKIGDGAGMSGDIQLYSYMHDTHIDTALKRYVSEHPELAV